MSCLVMAGGYTTDVSVTSLYNSDINTGTLVPPEVPNYLAPIYNPFDGTNSVTQANGNPTTASGDPVNMATGNMYHFERDLSIKGRGGLVLVFERSYNSRGAVDGPLGFGWTHSFNQKLKLYGVESGMAKVSWIDGSGAEKFFATTNHSSGNIGTGILPTPAGIFVTLQRLADGSYTLREKSGLTYKFESATGPSGVPGTAVPVYARLLSITDRNGNTLTLSYTAATGCAGGTLLCKITDALGRGLTFTYTGNHLTQLQDFSGRLFQYSYDANGNMQSFKNPLAVTNPTTQPPMTYSYYISVDGVSLNHLMKQYTLPRGNGMRFEYYANGRVFRHTVVNTDGSLSPDQVNTFTYNDFRREAVQTNERGFERHFFFDANANPLKIVEENGAEHDYEYTQIGLPYSRTAKTSPLGLRTQFSYDANGNVTQITAPRGSTTKFFDFTAYNQPRRIQDARGYWTILRYDVTGNLTDTIQTNASYVPATCSGECAIPAATQILSWTVNGYDSVGNLTSSKRVKDFASQITTNTPTSPTGPIMSYSYDTNKLNVLTISRTGIKNNDVTASTQSATLGYDTLGRLKTGVDSDWYPASFDYDSLDRVIQGTDKLGQLRHYQFDANGNAIGQTLAVPQNGSLTLVDSSAARFDGADRLQATLDAGGNVSAYQYDAAGNVIQITNPDNYRLGIDYDATNHAITAYDEEGNAVSTDPDAEGKPRSRTDPNGNRTAYIYWDGSRDGRLKSTTSPIIQGFSSGHALQYDYDSNGNIITLTDVPAGGSGLGNRITSTQYDEMNRPVRIVGPQYTDATYGAVCPVTQYSYDSLGRRTQVKAGYTPSPCTTASSDVTKVQETLVFDEFDRLTKRTDALGKFATYIYDTNNNLSSMTDAKNQTLTYTWDIGHQLLSRTEPNGRKTVYTRNALGQALTLTHPEANTIYTYDTAHRLASVTDSRGNKTLSYDWSPGGFLNRLTDNEGRITSVLYDPVGRLAAITAPNNDNVYYRFDAGGRLIERRRNTDSSTRFVYNADNSLQQVVNRHTASTILTQHDYSYDGVGNRATQIETIGGSTINYAYSYDELKRLIQVSNGTAASQENYRFDPWHNRTQKTIGNPVTSTLAYKYDDANQLTEIHSGSLTGPLLNTLIYDNNGNLQSDGTRTYTWDALNQLSQVTKSTTTVVYGYDAEGKRLRKVTGGVTTQWVYDGQDIYSEYGSTWTTPAVVYTGGGGIDDPVIRATVTGASTYGQAQYYYADGLGSVVGLSNNTDSTTQTQRFDAWGNKLTGTIAPSAQYGYTGREPDETGLIYYRARYYDPSLGRFVQRDPMGLQAGINLYMYVGGNPVNRTDPNGERPLTEGETAFLMTIYNNKVDYTKIDVQSGVSLDPRTWGPIATNSAVTLENTINFPSSGYQEDFSKADPSLQRWLVHEVGHVYQYQKNPDYSWVDAAAEGLRSDTYQYQLDFTKLLNDYRYEQQAVILADYYRALATNSPATIEYETILGPYGLGNTIINTLCCK